MAIIARYQDKIHHNKAIIETVSMRPYYGAQKQVGYRAKITDADGIMYYVSCYETATDAHNALVTKFGGLELIEK